jgi:hypothetical protein
MKQKQEKQFVYRTASLRRYPGFVYGDKKKPHGNPK